MLDHVIVFRPKDGLTPDEEGQLFAQMRRLAGVPGVLAIAFGRNVTDRSRGFDICLRVTFADKAAHDAYEVDPVHVEVAAFNRTMTSEHLAVDFPWEPIDEAAR